MGLIGMDIESFCGIEMQQLSTNHTFITFFSNTVFWI